MALSKTARKVLTDLAEGKYTCWTERFQPTGGPEDRYEMQPTLFGKWYRVQQRVLPSLMTAGYLSQQLNRLLITRAGLEAIETE
jgi:hypothetical protein